MDFLVSLDLTDLCGILNIFWKFWIFGIQLSINYLRVSYSDPYQFIECLLYLMFPEGDPYTTFACYVSVLLICPPRRWSKHLFSQVGDFSNLVLTLITPRIWTYQLLKLSHTSIVLLDRIKTHISSVKARPLYLKLFKPGQHFELYSSNQKKLLNLS